MWTPSTKRGHRGHITRSPVPGDPQGPPSLSEPEGISRAVHPVVADATMVSPPSEDDGGTPQVVSSFPPPPRWSERGSAPSTHEAHPTSPHMVSIGVPVADYDLSETARDSLPWTGPRD